MKPAIIRLTLTIALLIPVYRETGPWTVTVLALLTIANELSAYTARTRPDQHAT